MLEDIFDTSPPVETEPVLTVVEDSKNADWIKVVSWDLPYSKQDVLDDAKAGNLAAEAMLDFPVMEGVTRDNAGL